MIKKKAKAETKTVGVTKMDLYGVDLDDTYLHIAVPAGSSMIEVTALAEKNWKTKIVSINRLNTVYVKDHNE